MTTAGDVINRVLDRLDESETSPRFWSRSELLQHVNDGILELTLMTGRLNSDRTYAMIGSKIQAVPAGAIALIHVSYAGAAIEKSSIENFDRLNIQWDNQSGILKKWAPCGLDKWFCDRQPTAAENVTLTTLDEPATLAEGDVIDLDPEYVEALEYYAFHMARFKESGAEFQQAMTAYDDFLAIVGHVEQRTMSQQFTLWSRDPNSDTGMGYSTMNRS